MFAGDSQTAITALTEPEILGGSGAAGSDLLPATNVRRGVWLQNDPASSNEIVVNGGLWLAPGAREFFPVADASRLVLTTSGSATFRYVAL